MITGVTSAQNAGISLDNQASTWFGMNFPDEVAWQAGARYIPTLSPVGQGRIRRQD